MDNSSQTFRNVYQHFYDEFRRYLWSYSVLVNLANVEVDIYTDFMDLTKLKSDFMRLNGPTLEVRYNDEAFKEAYEELESLINDTESNSFMLINRVQEVNPETSKILNLAGSDSEEEGDINNEDNKESFNEQF